MEGVQCSVVVNVSGGVYLSGDKSLFKAVLKTILRAIKWFILVDLFGLLFGMSPKELIYSMKQL